MSLENGYDLLVYVNTTAWSTAVGDWDAIPNITESGLPHETDEATSQNRSKKYKTYDLTWIAASMTVTVEVDEEDLVYQALVSAATAAPATVIGVGVGPRNAVASNELYAFDAVVKMGEEAHPNDGPKTRSFEFKPAMRGTHLPGRITLTSS